MLGGRSPGPRFSARAIWHLYHRKMLDRRRCSRYATTSTGKVLFSVTKHYLYSIVVLAALSIQFEGLNVSHFIR